MKRTKLGLLALVALMSGGTAQAMPTTVNPAATQAKQTLKTPTRESKREILPDGMGGLLFPYIDHGTSPKEYGQWLQKTGRQIWNKKK